jgi:nitroimidazol reductase NimA-like FMN-containing flavoprotein (pyridoxamine 5'-phosphate oxidase superfamily)
MYVALYALDRETAEAMLRRHHVGRIAFSHHNRVTIRLVSYVFADGWIYARMELESGVVSLRHNPWVAFEVDEIDDTYGWRTVTVHGSVDFLDDPTTSATPVAPASRHAYDAAVRLLRSAGPAVLAPDDSRSEWPAVHRIHVDEIMGVDARGDASGALPSAR